MKQFTLKSSLAYGLAYRLETLDAQMVVDACKIDVIEAVRANQRVVKKINESNKVFVDAVTDTEQKKRAILKDVKERLEKETEGMDTVAKQAKGAEYRKEFEQRAAEVQKESKAEPNIPVEVEISDDDYTNVLMPVFKKTVQLWDVNGDGSGQKTFLEVANALENVKET